MRLKELREKAGLSQKEVAEYLACTDVTYSRYENSKREPSLDVLMKLADFFNVSVDYLLGRTDNPNLYKHDLSMPENHTAYAIATSKEPPSPDIGERALEFARKNAIPVSELKDDQGHPIDLATWLQDQIRHAVKEELQKQADLAQPERDSTPQQDPK